MPILYLDRTFELSGYGETATVVCEPAEKVSSGWCARIVLNPDAPYGLWTRRYLDAKVVRHDERPLDLHVYEDLERGYYEAHSTFRARRSIAAYFRVTARGGIQLLGTDGDEDAVIARLNRMTLDELQAARAADAARGGLPRLEGTVKQVAWATDLRATMLELAGRAGDARLVDRIRRIRDSTWFIANIKLSLDDLREQFRRQS